MQNDAGVEHRTPQRTDEEPRLNGRAVSKEHAAAKHGRCATGRHLVARKRHGFLGVSDGSGGFDGAVDGGVLRRSSRDHHHPGLTQPNVLASLLCERAHARNDRLRRAREPHRVVVAEHGARRRERRPVAVEKTTVSPARPCAADVRLEQRDAQVGIALVQRERRPEAGVATADDRDVGRRFSGERGSRLGAVLGRERLLEPPGRRPRLDGRH